MSAGKQMSLELDSRVAADVGDGAGCVEPPVRLRQSRRARHLQIRVSPWKGVEVIIPPRRSAREVEAFIAGHREWIHRAWQRLLAEYPEAGVLRLPEQIELPLLARRWAVRHTSGNRLRERGEELLLPDGEDLLTTACRLQEWVKHKARTVLPPMLAEWSERTGLYPEKVSIRGQATRWGSCSTRRTISLNFRLLFLEQAEVDCLLLHELCHLKHLNHGKRFWALMEKHMASARERDAKLGEGWKLVPPWALVK